MSLKDVFKKPEQKGPQVVEVKKKKKAVKNQPAEVYDFSYNEYRFGHTEGTESFFKSYPVAASLYGFFKMETQEITAREYNMWKDSFVNPQKYVITAENMGRGFKKYTINFKE